MSSSKTRRDAAWAFFAALPEAPAPVLADCPEARTHGVQADTQPVCEHAKTRVGRSVAGRVAAKAKRAPTK